MEFFLYVLMWVDFFNKVECKKYNIYIKELMLSLKIYKEKCYFWKYIDRKIYG